MSPKSSLARLTTNKNYDSKNARGIYLKLNRKTDKDILDHLDSMNNKQGYIKELIRSDMENRR